MFYFYAACERVGIWPAAEPTEQVWPFLGEHLKGSWQDPQIQSWKRARGGKEGRELQECGKHTETFRASHLRKAPAGRRLLPQVREGAAADLLEMTPPHGSCGIEWHDPALEEPRSGLTTTISISVRCMSDTENL